MKLRLAEIFTSRMVLQHGKEINIFGTGETNQQVTITIQGQTATTTIINNNWLITLPALEISTDETLIVSTGLETITLSNILIGDVYFLAGQSNIEFKFKDCDSVKVDQEVCYDRYLRYYEVPQIEYEDEYRPLEIKAGKYVIIKRLMIFQQSVIILLIICVMI